MVLILLDHAAYHYLFVTGYMTRPQLVTGHVNMKQIRSGYVGMWKFTRPFKFRHVYMLYIVNCCMTYADTG